MLLNLSGVKYHFDFCEGICPDVLWLDEACDVDGCGVEAGEVGSNWEDVGCIPPELLALEDIRGNGGFG